MPGAAGGGGGASELAAKLAPPHQRPPVDSVDAGLADGPLVRERRQQHFPRGRLASGAARPGPPPPPPPPC